jgi:hypothetical protein
VTASHERRAGHRNQPKPRNPDPAATITAIPSTPAHAGPESPAAPTTPETRDRKRPNAEPESRRRHWHPAVPGMGGAVPAARRLGGGRRC